MTFSIPEVCLRLECQKSNDKWLAESPVRKSTISANVKKGEKEEDAVSLEHG